MMNRKPTIWALPLFGAATLLILGPMLLPGYILTLDMIWTPDSDLRWSDVRPNNSFPVHLLIYLLSLTMPSWVVQKLILIALFFALFYLPYRFLPFIEHTTARIFAAAIFVLNPFVYTRLLAGQWPVLLGYAAYPVLMYALHRVTLSADWRNIALLGLALLATSLGSIHMLYIALLVSFVWVAAHAIRKIWVRDGEEFAKLISRSVFVGIVAAVVSSYWLVPMLLRDFALESHFDDTHYETFSAASHGSVPVTLNVLAQSGFWAEDEGWQYYFAWPQEHPLFWVAFVGLCMLILYGLYNGLRAPGTRFVHFLILILGAGSFIAALGASPTIFKEFNLFLYHHVPGWNGLRDSTKLVGVLALVYAICAARGLDGLLGYVRASRPVLLPYVSVGIFIVPVFLGMYHWGGFQRQLEPVWYPESWYEVRELVAEMPHDKKVLVLPWQGYISLPFANQLLVANPLPRFIGTGNLVTSRSVGVGSVYHQEVDPEYLEFDTFVMNIPFMTAEDFLDELRRRNIRYILVIENSGADNGYLWLFPYPEDQFSEEGVNDDILSKEDGFVVFPFKTVIKSDITVYDTESAI